MLSREELFRIDSLSKYEDSPQTKEKQSQLFKDILEDICFQTTEESNPAEQIEYPQNHELVENLKSKMIYEKYSQSQILFKHKNQGLFENKIKQKAQEFQVIPLQVDIDEKSQEEKSSQLKIISQQKYIKTKLSQLYKKRQYIGNNILNKAESCIIDQIKSLEKQLNCVNKIIRQQSFQETQEFNRVNTYDNFKIGSQASTFNQDKGKNSQIKFDFDFKEEKKKLIPSYLNIVIFSAMVLFMSIIYLAISKLLKINLQINENQE